jgi:hypothetical protein
MPASGKLVAYKVALARAVVDRVVVEADPNALVEAFLRTPEADVVPDPGWVLDRLNRLAGALSRGEGEGTGVPDGGRS